MIVWVLFLVLVVPVEGFHSRTFIEKYSTEEECTTEMKRILSDMKNAYPGDTSFEFECVPREKK